MNYLEFAKLLGAFVDRRYRISPFSISKSNSQLINLAAKPMYIKFLYNCYKTKSTVLSANSTLQRVYLSG